MRLFQSLVFAIALIGTGLFGSYHSVRTPAAEIEWKDADGVRIPVPPAQRPRLYLTPAHLGQLKGRRESEILAPVVERLGQLARRDEAVRIEWAAVDYLVTGDRQQGRSVVEGALKLLQRTELPDRNDACRVTGRMMVTGAIVYDWLYPLLSEQEKQAFVRELVRLAKTLECGYPPTQQGSVTGHSSEAMIMRDLLSAGIAVYDEYPEMYDLAASRFFREHLPARNWLYDGHAYHQGDSYGPYRFGWDTFPLFIFDRLGAGNVYNPEQRQVPYLWVYKTRPDGQRLRAGDTYLHSRDKGQPWGVGAGPLLVASYYGDGKLLSHYLEQGGNRDNELLFEFLWRDLTLVPEPTTDLPRTRYFGSPFGWMVARTGWGPESVIAEMKVNEYNFTNHQHMDAGAFQVYYQGALAIDSGVYSGSSGQYGSPHCRNYYWRTIAHNSLLVHDPDEVFSRGGEYGNDGGQRLPNNRREPKTLDVLRDPANGYRTGRVLAQGFGPDAVEPKYSLLTGDITAAYSDKVEFVGRSFVFLNLHNQHTPAILAVFDRVVSREPAFKKTWLLHSMQEPQVFPEQVVVDSAEGLGRGRLVLHPLLPSPEDRLVKAIGGPGKEYMVGDQNYANDQLPERLKRSSMELGSWRVEVSPKQPAAENMFLNVMQVTDMSNANPLPTELVDAGNYLGFQVFDTSESWVVLYERNFQRGSERLSCRVTGDGPCHLLVTGLSAGQWRAQIDSMPQPTVTVDEASGAAWFDGTAGLWQVWKASAE